MTNSQSKLNSEQHIADILPLVKLPERKVPSSERTTFKLNTNPPAEAASPKMDFNVNHLTGTETTREVITFVARVRELKVGLGITDDERMAQFHRLSFACGATVTIICKLESYFLAFRIYFVKIGKYFALQTHYLLQTSIFCFVAL